MRSYHCGSIVAARLALITLVLAMAPAPSRAGTLWINACGSFGSGVFTSGDVPGIRAANKCPGGALELQSTGTSSAGARAHWQAIAPPGISINHFWVGNGSLVVNGINDSGGEFGGGFYWKGGGATVHSTESGYSSPTFSSPYVGWQMVCGQRSCPDDVSALYVYQIQLQATENSGPGMSAPAGLWASNGWVRGNWPVSMYVSDPSGVCDAQAILNGRLIADAPAGKDQTAWQQCPNNPYLQTINTAEYGAGPLPLTLKATNAADVSNTYTKTVYVDNQPPTVNLSGPQDAPSTAGVQYVTATGSAGASGVAGIACSLDGSPAQ